jgi:hypothetical protein
LIKLLRRDEEGEQLRDSLRQKKADVNEIYRYAKVCRVSNVIRPLYSCN